MTFSSQLKTGILSALILTSLTTMGSAYGMQRGSEGDVSPRTAHVHAAIDGYLGQFTNSESKTQRRFLRDTNKALGARAVAVPEDLSGMSAFTTFREEIRTVVSGLRGAEAVDFVARANRVFEKLQGIWAQQSQSFGRTFEFHPITLPEVVTSYVSGASTSRATTSDDVASTSGASSGVAAVSAVEVEIINTLRERHGNVFPERLIERDAQEAARNDQRHVLDCIIQNASNGASIIETAQLFDIVAPTRNAGLLRFLLDRVPGGIDSLERIDVFGDTPAQRAARNGNVGFLGFLVAHARSGNGILDMSTRRTRETPIQLALRLGRADVLGFMVDNGPRGNAVLEVVDYGGWAPAIVAAEGGDRVTLQFIAEHAPSGIHALEAADRQGWTGAYHAANLWRYDVLGYMATLANRQTLLAPVFADRNLLARRPNLEVWLRKVCERTDLVERNAPIPAHLEEEIQALRDSLRGE